MPRRPAQCPQCLGQMAAGSKLCRHCTPKHRNLGGATPQTAHAVARELGLQAPPHREFLTWDAVCDLACEEYWRRRRAS